MRHRAIGVSCQRTSPLEGITSPESQQIATDITDEYNKELNPGPTQLLYDALTDHGRNEVVVKDAVAHALKNISIESTQPTTNPRN